MDILKRLDRQLLKNEIYDVVRFNIDIERGYGYIPNPTKISLLHKEAHISFKFPVCVIPYTNDNTNGKFIILTDSRVMEIERFTGNTMSIRSSVCMDPYKWHTFTVYSNPGMFKRITQLYIYCMREISGSYMNGNYAEGTYNYEKYVKEL